jgi:hypothetical protein
VLGQDDSHKAKYREKAKKILKIENDGVIDLWYDDKININEQKKFKKLGIDLEAMSSKLAGGFDFRERVLLADAVVEGTVIEKSYDVRKQALFKSSYKINVQEVLAGKNVDKEIIVLRKSGKDSRTSDEAFSSGLNVGDTFIFYLYKEIIDRVYKYKDSDELKRVKLPQKDVSKEKNVYTELPYSTLRIRDAFVYRSYGRIDVSYDIVKKTIKQIAKVNNKDEFKLRDYKISSEGKND